MSICFCVCQLRGCVCILPQTVLNLVLKLFAVVLGFTLTDAIKCYQCAVKPTPKKGNYREMKPPCQNFTPAAIYEVECGNSTYCMKQSYNFTLLNGNCVNTLLYSTHYNNMQMCKNSLTVILYLSVIIYAYFLTY